MTVLQNLLVAGVGTEMWKFLVVVLHSALDVKSFRVITLLLSRYFRPQSYAFLWSMSDSRLPIVHLSLRSVVYSTLGLIGLLILLVFVAVKQRSKNGDIAC